jgi:hypothetical protein
MAADEYASFLIECERISAKFNDSINTSGNISRLIKASLLECLQDFQTLVKNQNFALINKEKEINCKLRSHIDRHYCETKQLSQQIAEIKDCLANKSYSAALQSSTTTLQSSCVEKTVQKTKNLVIIRPNNEAAKCKQTETAIKSLFISNKICVKNVRNISKGGIIVEFETSEECEKAIKLIEDKTHEFRATKPHNKPPKICVYNISDDFDSDGLLLEIINNNKLIKDYLKEKKIDVNDSEKVSEEIKIKFKFRRKTRNGDNTWVLEISPELRKSIFSQMRSLLIGWKSCGFADFHQPIRCFKCNAFGHLAKHCKQQEFNCGFCGQSHDTRLCKREETQPFCVNCDKHNKIKGQRAIFSTNHPSFSNECEYKKKVIENIIEKTNYV